MCATQSCVGAIMKYFVCAPKSGKNLFLTRCTCGMRARRGSSLNVACCPSSTMAPTADVVIGFEWENLGGIHSSLESRSS